MNTFTVPAQDICMDNLFFKKVIVGNIDLFKEPHKAVGCAFNAVQLLFDVIDAAYDMPSGDYERILREHLAGQLAMHDLGDCIIQLADAIKEKRGAKKEAVI